MPWLIGDIHGCLNQLNRLLDQIPRDETLIFLGDYIDRGPHSAQVVDRLLLLGDRAEFLMGNHEAMLLAYYTEPTSPGSQTWMMPGNGAPATLKSYGFSRTTPWERYPAKHIEFYNKLKLWLEGDDFIAVHAGLDPDGDLTPAGQKHSDLLWTRERWIRNEMHWRGKQVYYGHTPSRYVNGLDGACDPIRGEKSTGIDTGCVYGNALTAIHHPDGEIIQVSCRELSDPGSY